MSSLIKTYECRVIKNYAARNSLMPDRILDMKPILITVCLLVSHSILEGALANSIKIQFTAEESYSIEVARVEVGDKAE